MAKRHFVQQEDIVIQKADFFHAVSLPQRRKKEDINAQKLLSVQDIADFIEKVEWREGLHDEVELSVEYTLLMNDI